MATLRDMAKWIGNRESSPLWREAIADKAHSVVVNDREGDRVTRFKDLVKQDRNQAANPAPRREADSPKGALWQATTKAGIDAKTEAETPAVPATQTALNL